MLSWVKSQEIIQALYYHTRLSKRHDERVLFVSHGPVSNHIALGGKRSVVQRIYSNNFLFSTTDSIIHSDVSLYFWLFSLSIIYIILFLNNKSQLPVRSTEVQISLCAIVFRLTYQWKCGFKNEFTFKIQIIGCFFSVSLTRIFVSSLWSMVI